MVFCLLCMIDAKEFVDLCAKVSGSYLTILLSLLKVPIKTDGFVCSGVSIEDS